LYAPVITLLFLSHKAHHLCNYWQRVFDEWNVFG
jgi:hypothetical protein